MRQRIARGIALGLARFLADDAAAPDAGDDLEPFVAALDGGGAVAVPTDTVYGLACAAHLPDACARDAGAQGPRPLEADQHHRRLPRPSSHDACSPELTGRAGGAGPSRLLPGPVTRRRARTPAAASAGCAVTTRRGSACACRVLDPALARAIDRVGAIAATSANMAGGADPASLDEVPDELLDRSRSRSTRAATPAASPRPSST